jgi:hypothetical protein
MRLIESSGCDLTIESLGGFPGARGRASLFDAWKADPAQEGTPIAPEAVKPSTVPETGSATYAEADGGITMIERLGPSCATGGAFPSFGRQS